MSEPSTQQQALITGAKGGLGKVLTDTLRKQGLQVSAPGHDELDVTSPESVKSAFQRYRSCAAVFSREALVVLRFTSLNAGRFPRF